jgi:hypothetical protein
MYVSGRIGTSLDKRKDESTKGACALVDERMKRLC